MKKLIVILVLLSLFACQKDKYCWKCQEFVSQMVYNPSIQGSDIPAGYPNLNVLKKDTCNLTKSEIHSYEKQNLTVDSSYIIIKNDQQVDITWLLVTKKSMNCKN